MSCSCESFCRSNECKHTDAIFQNLANKIRLITLTRRAVHASSTTGPYSGWSCIHLPSCEGDDVALLQVFLRDHVSSTFRSSSTMILDTNRSVRNRRVEDRAQCCICPGVASNRMLCIHEKIAIEFVQASEVLGMLAMNERVDDTDVNQEIEE